MYDYLDHHGERAIERKKAIYEKLAAQYYELLSASDEGVFEITVRSQSGSITIPVDLKTGNDLTCNLADAFAVRVDKLEEDLNMVVQNLGLDNQRVKHQAAADGREARVAGIEAQAAAIEAARIETLQTPARQVGRPRKQTMHAVGQMAAQVPMNGSTAHAAARATNLPGA